MGSNRYILLIDDDEDDRLLFRLAAQEVDATVRCEVAQDSTELSKLLHPERPLPDVIFLDLNMPVKSGWDYLAKFKADPEIKHVPVIIYSTSSSQRDIDRARDMNALCFLVKPDDFTDLKRMLSIVITKSEMQMLDDLRSQSGPCRILKG